MSLDRRMLLGLGAGALLAPALQGHAQTPTTVLRCAWWGGAGRHASTLKAIALFEARNPGVKVKCEYMGFHGYLERLTMQIAGRSEPDVMQINWAWLAMFSKRGNGFLDLNPYHSDLDLDQFAPQDLDAGRVAGKLNALPASYTARVLLWKQTTFERAGLAVPRTWDELFAAGSIFQARLGEQAYPLDGELYDMVLLAQAYVQQKYGTPYVDPLAARVAMDSAAALEWVQTYRRLVDQHVATPLRLRASLGGAEKPTEQQQDWVAGNWAGNFAWDSAIPLRASTLKAPQRLVLGDFPMLPGSRVSGMFGRPSVMFAAGRNTRQPELAARLVNFLLTDPDAARILGKTRGLPSAQRQRTVVLQTQQLPAIELAAQAQIQQQRDAHRVPVPAPLFEHARLHRFLREVFERVAYGKTTDRAAATRLIDEGNALLKRL